jgi:hypothetical protein
MAMKACPYRKDFYKNLAADPDGGPGASQEKLDEALNEWLAALQAIVHRLHDFYVKNKYGEVFKN